MKQLTRSALNNYLWQAADILRGSIDSSDYKGYIFGFLFLKRMSDRFEEEAKERIAEGVPADIAYNDPDEHEFYVPERARWDVIRKATTDIGSTLNKACEALEDANAAIEGVLVNIDFNSESRLGEPKNREVVLAALVDHFTRIDLSNASLSEPDILGRAYEYLIEQFADDAGKKGGEFYTPHEVVNLIVQLLDPSPGMRISDPTCGSGGMLIQAAEYVGKKEGKRLGQPINVTLHGQEKNLGTWAIAKMNLLLHGLRDARIEKGDTIRNPRLLDHEGNLILYDRVIANPPFSLDKWGAVEAASDTEKLSFNRFRYGIPAKNIGDFAFVQHMLATLNHDGLCGVVMPHGVLFRGSGDGRIRKALLEEDLIEAVVGLPENLFAGTGIPAIILILNRNKAAEHKDKILFIHASKEFEERTKKAVLGPNNISHIVDTFRKWKEVERFSRVVEMKEVEENDYNLNISRYIDTLEPEAPIDVQAALSALWEAEKARNAAEGRMNELLRDMGYVG